MVKKIIKLPIPLKPNKIFLQFLVGSLLFFWVSEIFYLSWLPNGHLGKETYLPLWLLNWSNTYFNLRTAIPFTALSFLLQAWYSISSKVLISKIRLPFWLINIFIATLLVCLAEVGQFFILLRHPDFKDVLYGILGSVLGCVLHYLFNILIQLILLKNEKQT